MWFVTRSLGICSSTTCEGARMNFSSKIWQDFSKIEPRKHFCTIFGVSQCQTPTKPTAIFDYTTSLDNGQCLQFSWNSHCWLTLLHQFKRLSWLSVSIDCYSQSAEPNNWDVQAMSHYFLFQFINSCNWTSNICIWTLLTIFAHFECFPIVRW